ncbi:LysR family transcriptional regulator [Pacificibacter maritimus]|nr:LysR family transcriptional regulator [Pacificibacter maritimus]
MKLLLAFDAVMRHGSITRAAQELDLTQSAVSRLILSLEKQLGKDLFQRTGRKLVPNTIAHRYQNDVARALDIVQRSSMGVVANPDGGTLSLAVLPTFASRWLGPRLAEFLKTRPGIAVNLSTRLQKFDFADEAFDAAILFGPSDWDEVHAVKLFDEKLTACAAPDYLRQFAVRGVQDLANHSLLHLESRPTAWRDWMGAQGDVDVDHQGMIVDQFSMMIQAAISGLGIALLPDYLAQIEISEGRLAPVLRQAVPVSGAYWLIWPEGRVQDQALAAFRDWICGQGGG